jgi:hypothetical protein
LSLLCQARSQGRRERPSRGSPHHHQHHHRSGLGTKALNPRGFGGQRPPTYRQVRFRRMNLFSIRPEADSRSLRLSVAVGSPRWPSEPPLRC